MCEIIVYTFLNMYRYIYSVLFLNYEPYLFHFLGRDACGDVSGPV